MFDPLRSPIGAIARFAAFLALAASPGFAAQNPHVIPDTAYVMDDLVAVHSESAAGAITSTPDGSYTFVAEGGTVTMVVHDPTATNPQAAYETPRWRVQVGSLGVVPVEMVLDPEMESPPPDSLSTGEDPNALLYIAGGRDGFWVMDAKLSNFSSAGGSASHKAYRIDDSGDSDPLTQHSIKWCNDVKIVEFANKTYILALFGARGRSILRVYDLEDVRAVAAQGLETGNEIAAAHTFKLLSNPNVVATPGGNVNAEAYAFGMAPDLVGASEAYIYVAMGEHGIFRVHMQSVGGALQPAPTIEHGPWFGAGSPYRPFGFMGGRQLYGPLRYYLPSGSTNANNLVATYNPYFLDVAVQNDASGDHRLYAAVDNLGWCGFNLNATWGELIYTTTSQMGPHPGFPDFIQEGTRHQIASQGNDEIHLYDNTAALIKDRFTAARHLEVVTTYDETLDEEFSTLVVTAAFRRFATDPGRMNEGRVIGSQLNLGAVPADSVPEASSGKLDYLYVYDLREYTDLGSNTKWTFNDQNLIGAIQGGWDLHVPEVQPAGELHVIYGADIDALRLDEPIGKPSGKNNLVRAWFDPWPTALASGSPPPGHSGSVVRGRHYRLGRETVSVGASKLDPRVLVTSGNDAGVVPDGPLVFDPTNGEIRAPFATLGYATEPMTEINAPLGAPIPAGQNNDLTFGVVMDPRGGFVGSDVTGDHEYRMGVRPRDMRLMGDPATTDPTHFETWRAVRFSVTEDPGTQEVNGVTIDKSLYFVPPPGKFSPDPYNGSLLEDRQIWSGRGYYSSMATFEDYNLYVASHFGLTVDSKGIMFCGTNSSPQGMWAMRLSVLQTALDSAGAPSDNALVQPELYAQGAQVGDIFLGAIVTHPEYWNVDDVRTASSSVTPHVDAEYFMRKTTSHGVGEVLTWNPDLFEMLIDPEATETGWILAVACGYIAFDAGDDIVVGNSSSDPPQVPHPSWAPPAEFQTGHSRMMVRLFDVSDPTKFETVPGSGATGPNLDSQNLPAITMIGPELETCASMVKGVRMIDAVGATKQLLIVGDLVGKLFIYDITTVLQTMGSQSPANGTHYGSFITGQPLLTYTAQKSLSDDAASGVFGLEVCKEAWTVGQTPVEATYVYIGLPRVGVEVAELRFNSANVLELGYIGRIQTPGNGSQLYKQTIDNTDYLFVGDYDAGIRVYKHHAPGGQ